MYSLVIICTSAKLKSVNSVFETLGQGSNYLTVALTSDGVNTSHYAARADVTDDLKAKIESMKMSADLDFSVAEQPYDHFMRVLEDRQLSIFL